MKRFIFPVLILLILGTVYSRAHANDLPFLETAFSKRYYDKSVYPHKEIEIMIRVITNTNIDAGREKENVLLALQYHQRLCQAFKRKQWKICHLLDEKQQAGAIELTFEPRMNLKLKGKLVIKTFVYVCESDRLWNTIKYRGGNIDKYFNKVTTKAEDCIMRNHNLDIGG